MARVVAVAARATTSCRAPRSTGTARRRCRPPGWRSTRSRPARATCSSPRASRPCPGSPRATPTPGRTPRTRCSTTAAGALDRRGRGRRRWHDPRADGHLPDVYIAMGQTAENVATHDRHQPRGPGPLRRAQPEPRRGGDRERVLRARDHPGHPARRHARSAPTTARGPGTTYEKVSELKPVFRPERHGHRRQLLPAQRRRRRPGDHVSDTKARSWA